MQEFGADVAAPPPQPIDVPAMYGLAESLAPLLACLLVAKHVRCACVAMHRRGP